MRGDEDSVSQAIDLETVWSGTLSSACALRQRVCTLYIVACLGNASISLCVRVYLEKVVYIKAKVADVSVCFGITAAPRHQLPEVNCWNRFVSYAFG